MYMKNLKKRTASLLLAILSVASMAVSCSSGNTGNNTSPENNADTPTAAETTAAAETEIPTIPESLPNVNYDGYVFRMLTTDEVGSVRYSFELDTDAMNGDVLNDAVYERNMAVEERFGVKIEQIPYDKSGFLRAYQNSVTAGDDSYDLFFHSISWLVL